MAIKWRLNEIDFLGKNARNLSVKEIAGKLNKSVGGVYQKAYKLQIPLRMGCWKEDEIVFLKNNYEKMGIRKISEILNRSYYGVHKKARRLDLIYKHKTWKEELEFPLENKNSVVNYKDIIKTFEVKERTLALNYIKAKEMRKNAILLKNIAKSLSVPDQTIRGWSSKTTPRTIHCINRLTTSNLLPLVPENTEKFILFLKIFAWIFGDGHISDGFSLIVLAGDEKTIEPLYREIKSIFPSFKVGLKTVKTEGNYQGRKIKGMCTNLTIHDSPFARLLYAAGAPKGNKVIQKFRLPKWIFTVDKRFQAIFLGALWSTDGSKPVWSKGGFYLCFQMSKSLKFKNEHERFLNFVRRLFKNIGVETSKVRWSKRPYQRKDGEVTDKAYFYVSTKAENFIKFYKNIPIFNPKRHLEFERTYSIVENKLKNKEGRRELFIKANVLYKNGFSLNEISKELKLPYSTIKVWVRGLHKPI